MKRDLLLAFSALLIFAGPSFRAPAQTMEDAPGKDLEIIKSRIVADLLTPVIDAGKIQRLIKTIRSDGSWPGINYTDTSKTGFEHRIHLENQFELAKAFRKKGTTFYHSPEVKATVSSALNFWITHDFICENWWWNEMGTPGLMINTLLLMDSDLTEIQKVKGAKIASRASLTGVGARAGGDFVPIAGMVCKQGLFKGNDSILEHALKVMVAQVEVTNARGINPDMGFHHRVDNVTSIHTYGTNYVNAFSFWAVQTANTKYSLPANAMKLLIDYYVDGVSKCMAYGIYADPGAENRDLSRKDALHAEGTEIPENLMKSSDYRRKELQYIVDVRKGKVKPSLTWNRYYWQSSYLAEQQKNYYASVRMHSSRQNNVEDAYNEEGLRMHHLADGANFILRTGQEYDNIFPCWDWQKIPGTTVVQKPELPSFRQVSKKGLSDFVGAATDDQFGVAAFDFKSVHDPLSAKKAWFFFDNKYVCLGAGINSSAEYPVATTINQSLLHGRVIFGPGNNALEGSGEYSDVSWIWHDSVGYVFPSPATVHMGNLPTEGNWRLITHQAWATDEPVIKNIFTAWFDHGRKPLNASYSYMIVPSVSQKALQGFSVNPGVKIISNTPELQAVQELELTEIVFYKPGKITLKKNIELTAKNACIVMVKLKGNVVSEFCVADPTQKLTSLGFELNAPFDLPIPKGRSSWNAEKKLSDIIIQLPADGYAGQSVVLRSVR